MTATSSPPTFSETCKPLSSLPAFLRAQASFLMTVRDNERIPIRPHPRQMQFLHLGEIREVMYGGAAGGGKSVALLAAAAQYIDVPGYAALILRENFADLMQPKALIPLSKEWWADRFDCKWNVQEKRWTFKCPGGGESSITFGYLERDDDVYQYQGAAYQCVCFDELTQFSEFRYRYLFSRLRRTTEGLVASVPLRMRSASNPGGRGHEWAKKRFIEPLTKARGSVFVPAQLDDNPSLDRASYVESLQHLDPVTRDQLLKGDWDAVEDGRFKRSWLRYYRRYGAGYHFTNGITVDPADIRLRFLTVDAAGTVKQTAGHDPDYTVVSAWVYGKGQLIWVGCAVTRCEIPDIPKLVAREYKLHKAQKVFFRPSGMEKGVPQLVRRHLDPPMNVVELPPKGDKLVSASEFLNMAESGRVWFPYSAFDAQPHSGPFPLEDVRSNLLRFTGATTRLASKGGSGGSGHDDIWDTAGIAGTVVESQLAGPGGKPLVIHAESRPR